MLVLIVWSVSTLQKACGPKSGPKGRDCRGGTAIHKSDLHIQIVRGKLYYETRTTRTVLDAPRVKTRL